MNQASEMTFIRGGRSYTAEAYRAAFAALPPEAGRAMASAVKQPVQPAERQAPMLMSPDGAVEALRRMVALPISRERSRELMQKEIAKGGPDLAPDGGHGAGGRAKPASSKSSMEREIERQGLKPVTR